MKQKLAYYPNSPGVYMLTNSSGKVLYVGRAKQLCRRVSHLTAMQKDKSNKAGLSHIKAGLVRKYQENGNDIYIEFIESEEPLALEKELILKHDPEWNINGRTKR